jgi:hypothetical protein
MVLCHVLNELLQDPNVKWVGVLHGKLLTPVLQPDLINN